MSNSKNLYSQIFSRLEIDESPDELEAIAFAVLDHFGVTRTDVLANKLASVDQEKIDNVIKRLNQHEPLQYILNEAWFCGRKFFVNPSVLIPRPETELLVEEAVKLLGNNPNPTILDVGTGSGCIAISLALMYRQANVLAIDVSEAALNVARQNAEVLNANVNWLQGDALANLVLPHQFDMIVSNPPYIGSDEISSIAKNVVDYEPHLALFIHGDALVFYRRLAKLAVVDLKAGGNLVTEINERMSTEVTEIYSSAGLKFVAAIKDLAGKSRVVHACKP